MTEDGWTREEFAVAAGVKNFDVFLESLNRVKRSRDLFGFILFDDRAQHRTIKKFCIENFDWFDELASVNQMVFFLPIDRKEGGELEGSDDISTYRNCSLRIANEFHVGPNQLPAFLFFTLKEGEMCVEHSAYLSFAPRAFEGDANQAQDLVVDVFSAVSAARRNTDQRELILKLQSEIERIKRADQIRPLKTWALEFVLSLANLPADIARTLAQAGVKKLVGT